MRRPDVGGDPHAAIMLAWAFRALDIRGTEQIVPGFLWGDAIEHSRRLAGVSRSATHLDEEWATTPEVVPDPGDPGADRMQIITALEACEACGIGVVGVHDTHRDALSPYEVLAILLSGDPDEPGASIAPIIRIHHCPGTRGGPGE